MTPRLKILSIGLALSLIYSVYDYVDRNKNKKPVVTKTKKKKKRARTAGVSLTRGVDLKKKIEARKQSEEKKNFTPQEGFLPISDDVAALEGWSRNPFVEVYEPPPMTKANPNRDIESNEKVEHSVFTSLDGLIIETAIRMGDKAFVTINGQTFTEGDLINDALIEKIENEQVTFKIGKTRIIKDVGT
mgnify:FL=1